jgi:hypothetical protein
MSETSPQLVFVGAAALVAVLDREVPEHFLAGETWRLELEEGSALVTTECSLIKAALEVQRKHGIAGVDPLLRVMRPVVRVERVTDVDIDVALAANLASGDTKRDIVDHLEHHLKQRLAIRLEISGF